MSPAAEDARVCALLRRQRAERETDALSPGSLGKQRPSAHLQGTPPSPAGEPDTETLLHTDKRQVGRPPPEPRPQEQAVSLKVAVPPSGNGPGVSGCGSCGQTRNTSDPKGEAVLSCPPASKSPTP